MLTTIVGPVTAPDFYPLIEEVESKGTRYAPGTINRLLEAAAAETSGHAVATGLMAAKRLMRQEEMLARRNDYNQPANAAANLSDVDMAPVLAIMEKPDTTGNIAYQSVLLLQALFVVMPDKLTAPDVTAALDIVAARSDHAGAQAAALLKNVTHYRVRTTKAAPVEALFGLDPR